MQQRWDCQCPQQFIPTEEGSQAFKDSSSPPGIHPLTLSILPDRPLPARYRNTHPLFTLCSQEWHRADLTNRLALNKQLKIAMLCSFRWNLKTASQMNILLCGERCNDAMTWICILCTKFIYRGQEIVLGKEIQDTIFVYSISISSSTGPSHATTLVFLIHIEYLSFMWKDTATGCP